MSFVKSSISLNLRVFRADGILGGWNTRGLFLS